jgi:integrase
MEIGPKTFRAFYASQRRATKGRTIKADTLHKDVIVVRQVLKHAMSEEQLDHLPMIPAPGKIEPDPPPPLTEAEWQHLCAVSRKRITEAPNVRTKQQRIDCDHFMRLLVASCARVDEIRGLRFRDCRYRLAEDGSSNILVATVTGKRGTRDVVADTDAFAILSERPGKPGDRIFPSHSRDAFRELLIAANLRADVKERVRNAKALRSTAICRALLAGKGVVFVAKNAGTGTSIDVISRYYSNRATNTYPELTLNQFRQLANRTYVSLLANVICKH